MPSGPLDVERDFEAAADGEAIAKAMAKAKAQAHADVAMNEGWIVRRKWWRWDGGDSWRGLHVRWLPKSMQHICPTVFPSYSRTFVSWTQVEW